MKQEEFKRAVERVNEILEVGEPENIEAVGYFSKKQNKDVEFTGYRIQYVIDAVNEGFGLDWKYDVVNLPDIVADKDFVGGNFWAEIRVYFKIGDEWLSKGVQYGTGSDVGSIGDSRKAAISDGLKKSFAVWGIGNKPFRGELKKPDEYVARTQIMQFIEALNKLFPFDTKAAGTVVKNALTNNYMVKAEEIDTLLKGDKERVLRGIKRDILKFICEGN